MLRLKQVFQNTFIRLIALLSALFNSVFGLVKKIFTSAGNILGFTNSSSVYLVESDKQEITKQFTDKTKLPVETGKTPEVATANRRRPKSNMDDFMKMAEELKKV